MLKTLAPIRCSRTRSPARTRRSPSRTHARSSTHLAEPAIEFLTSRTASLCKSRTESSPGTRLRVPPASHRRGNAAPPLAVAPAPPPSPPLDLVHPIRNQRIRFDPAYLFVLAHTIAIQRPRAIDHARFRSAVVVLLKTPSCFLLSTRSPPLLKNNCGLAQFLASKPLDFYLLEPAVQTCLFHELNPKTNL